MKLTQKLLDELRAKALEATPGKWKVQTCEPLVVANEQQTFRVQCCHRWGKINQAEKDMAFIAAANPETVIALVDEICRLRGEKQKG